MNEPSPAIELSLPFIFLIDGLGTLLTATMVGVVIPRFADLVGMPPPILHTLTVVALIFSVYSFACYRHKVVHRSFLVTIAVANGFYCLANLIIVLWQASQLTILGICYFLIESMLIATLAAYEWKTARRLDKN